MTDDECQYFVMYTWSLSVTVRNGTVGRERDWDYSELRWKIFLLAKLHRSSKSGKSGGSRGADWHVILSNALR